MSNDDSSDFLKRLLNRKDLPMSLFDLGQD